VTGSAKLYAIGRFYCCGKSPYQDQNPEHQHSHSYTSASERMAHGAREHTYLSGFSHHERTSCSLDSS
jgi:hypothetical protein